MKSENIVAISTALGASGVAVIRISGDSPLDVAEKMFFPLEKLSVRDFEPNKMYVGEIKTDKFSDFGMCVYFKAPKSFTGEDTIEFHSHGGVAITKGILEKALSSGARLANNGEFTKRAFINGKLSLSSAEGLIDMINAESVSGVKAGYSLYREKLTKKITSLQDKITEVLASIDVDIDYPEENLDKVSRETLVENLTFVTNEIEKLLSSFKTGQALKNGVNVALVGKPNTGKSSLLNSLLHYDKAIVSDIAGTTRDVVEGSIDIKDVRFNLFDTAGIRESGDKIESLGVDLSKKILNQADLIVFLLDLADFSSEDQKIFELVKDKNVLVVMNKMDKGDEKIENNINIDLKISALTGENIEKLKDAIYDKTVGEGIDYNGDYLVEQRHFEALKNAKEKLSFALSMVDSVPLDVVAIDIKDGWDYLGEISGKTATEEIINDIFSRFCVGK
ncbi:MAG: tRNA uridine-5-carboxymethylaminomethyl(34) synthesis GTPase MnmE [Clostridia bacterium]|nr:tRNA uridine-5-carboxymethylaminomethyl(34) synthesis GTPase MnmE [Clostridia bacterium]